MAAVPRVFRDLRHQDVAKLEVRPVGAEVGDAGVPGAEIGDSGHELVGSSTSARHCRQVLGVSLP